MTEHRAALLNFLAAKGLTPSSAWTEECVASQRAGVSLQQLQQTALFRLLASDITSVMHSSNNRLPQNVADPEQPGRTLLGPLLVQLLDIEDIGNSSWSQHEAIEAQERGETTRGNQVIRAVPDENGEMPTINRVKGPHKLLLEDIAGTRVYAFEMSPVKSVEAGCPIGMKLILENFQVARGMLLLHTQNVRVLGGRIEAYDNVWQSVRKQRLQHKVTQTGND